MIEHDREQPRRHLFARGHHRVVFARIMQRRGLARPSDKLIGRARHRGYDDSDLMASIDLALDVARHIADAVNIGDRRSAEFHHQARHAKYDPTKVTRSVRYAGALAKRRVYIPARSGA